MISLKHIKNGCAFYRIIKLKFSSKNLSSLINISLAYAGAAISIQRWLECLWFIRLVKMI